MSNKTFHRPSKFEDLSDEILMDIFDLLNPALFIYHSFYNLNGRFNRILHDSRLLMSLDLSRLISPSNFAYHCQMMLPNMFKQLIRLRLSNDFKLYEQINVFLRDFRFSQFEFLRQLSLVQIKFQQLSRVLYDILSLKNLIRLDIDTFDACGTSSEEIQYIANTFISQSSTIKYLRLRFNYELIIYENVSSSIIHLDLDLCFFSDILQLFSHCANLQSLTARVEQIPRRYSILPSLVADQHFQCQPRSSKSFSHLRNFSMDIGDLTLNDVNFILIHLPYLQRFTIEGLSYDMDFSDGDLWQKVFENQRNQLKEFRINGLRIWLGNHLDSAVPWTYLMDQIERSFNRKHPYWGGEWFTEQKHEIRSNHLYLNLHAKALSHINENFVRSVDFANHL